MKFMLLSLICVFAASLLTAAGQQQKRMGDTSRAINVPLSFHKAEEFADMTENDRQLYATGLMDGFFASGLLGADSEAVDSISSCTKQMDTKQISAIISKYVKDHPESWHHPLSVEAYNALNAVCPGGLKIIR